MSILPLFTNVLKNTECVIKPSILKGAGIQAKQGSTKNT